MIEGSEETEDPEDNREFKKIGGSFRRLQGMASCNLVKSHTTPKTI
jgi:hypothetical protein